MFKHRSRARRALTLLLAVSMFAGGLSFMPSAAAQTAPAAAPFRLTIDNIMRGPGLVGYEPRAVRWSADGQRVYFHWKRHDDPRDRDFDTYVANRDGSGLRKLSEEEARNAPPVSGHRTRDRRLTVFSENGDVFLYDHAAGRRRQLTATTDIETNPRFTHDEKKITFTRASNLYMLSLEDGSIRQMTDVRAAGAPSAAMPRADATHRRGTASQEYLKKEERDLLDIVKRRAERREEEEARRKRENPRKPFQLSPRQTVQAMQLTPDESQVIATVVDGADGAKNTIVPNYIAESAYTENLPARTKVGDAQPRLRLAIIDVKTGDVKWVDHGQKAQAPPARQRTEQTTSDPPAENAQGQAQSQQTNQSQSAQGRPSDERPVQLFQPVWSEDGSKAVLMARAADNKDRWILALDPVTGKTRVLFTDHDDAWIGGPGMFTLGWLGDHRTIYFQSEKSGYSHLYTVSFDGGEPRQLTSGRWEVTNVEISQDRKRFFLTTSEVHFGERHLYVMPVEGGERVRLTTAPGNHQSFIAPDEKWAATIYSYSNKPPELYVQPLEPNATAKKVTDSPAPEFWSYNWVDPPIVEIPARDGARVPARFYKPKNFRRGGPAVIFVHGAGYLQNVHRWWSNYFREYMFHHLLVENGYAVLDIDYRASAGHGRDWRTAIYRHMGGKDLDDQVDGAKWLVAEHGVDPKRIGIYGGSYGGFITLMAMFTQPDVFAAGASLRPVTDWAHYNHPYTSNILNQPQDDPEAYKRSSPIYFAEGLKGALLICHGMVDVNVHFQDTVRLVQRLIELGKENWEVAIYPIEDHGFVEPSSWADEYKRIFKLFEQNLKK